MPIANYGTRKIFFTHRIDDKLKHAYLTVDFHEGVILKSPAIDDEKAKALVCKKGRWIIEKINLVERIPKGPVSTGSRLLYLGRRYYAQVIRDESIGKAVVGFNHSKFIIQVNPELPDCNDVIDNALEAFFREKAMIKIKPRIKKWSKICDLCPNDIKFRKLNKRWGSCTAKNEIIINIDVVKLPFALIDYIVVHELIHIRYKDHSRQFYRELKKYFSDWEKLDDKLCGMKL
ncbi:SprT family zinc-dependent metalloprotease [Desulfobacterales bacterium HSG16]|nr:SprT family zinc-dependent metalloprotease [Desulfobacterales bacterium HSG16]